MEVKYKSIRNEVQVLQYDLETEKRKAEENMKGMKEEMHKNSELEEEIQKLREKPAAPSVDHQGEGRGTEKEVRRRGVGEKEKRRGGGQREGEEEMG